MFLSSYGPLALKWNYIPKCIVVLNYFKIVIKNQCYILQIMHQILSLSNDAYDEIFQEIDTSGLVEKKGIIYVWTNKNLKVESLS